MPRVVRLRSDGIPEIRAYPWHEFLGRGDVGLISALIVAWLVCTVLQLTRLVQLRFPLGALTLVLIRTFWASGTAWIAAALLGRGGVR